MYLPLATFENAVQVDITLIANPWRIELFQNPGERKSSVSQDRYFRPCLRCSESVFIGHSVLGKSLAGFFRVIPCLTRENQQSA